MAAEVAASSTGTGMLMSITSSPTAPRTTALVTAVPRPNKVSGGTQTNSAELCATQTVLKPIQTAPQQPRSCSLTGPTAAQLNQSLRERLASGSHSLPKQHHGGAAGGSDLHIFQPQQHHRMSLTHAHHAHHQSPNHQHQHHQQQHHQQHRPKLNDGSVSDTQTYGDTKPDFSSYAAWLKHSNTTNSRLSDCDSMESLAMSAAAAAAASGGMHQNRGHKLIHRDSTYSHSPRLNRSNSIR